MATNTETVTGVVTTPGGAPVTSGTVRFTLSGVDVDTLADEMLASVVTDAVIGADGSISVDLWPNDRGTRGTHYRVAVRRETENGLLEVPHGRIQVGEDGPYELADLLAAEIPAAEEVFYRIISQAEYDAALAARDEAVAAKDDAEAAAAVTPSPTANTFLRGNGAGDAWLYLTEAQVRAALGLAPTDSVTFAGLNLADALSVAGAATAIGADLPERSDDIDVPANYPSGMYKILIAAGGTKPTTNFNLLVMRREQGVGNSEITHVAFQGESMWFREYSSGTWSDWQTIYHNKNIVGEVSESSGTPTGAMIKSGSDPTNGSYIKFADGTMVCRIKRLTLSYSSVHKCVATWTFPESFSTLDEFVPIFTLIGATDATDAEFVADQANPAMERIGAVTTGNLSTTSIDVAVVRISGAADFLSGDEMFVSGMVTGRWY